MLDRVPDRLLPAQPTRPVRRLLLVLGDQLDRQAAVFDDADPAKDVVWMAEVAEESTHVWSAKPRIALFLAAMRHFAADLAAAGWAVDYNRLDDSHASPTLAAALDTSISRLRPAAMAITAPGDWRVLRALRGVAASHSLPLDIRDDRHFFCTVRDFAAHAAQEAARGRGLRMEFFYRGMRQRHGVLMEASPAGSGAAPLPAGGRWNFDTDNRNAFGKHGPPPLPTPLQVPPDASTQEVLALVAQRFAAHPGSLAHFAWPVTRADALRALERFIAERLPAFGHWQDALWPGAPWLWHAQLSAALNLKLLNPREVVASAQTAWQQDHVPLASAEGFIRQVLGWREYVRGVYWTQMPRYLQRNALGAQQPLPAFYWHGRTQMACLADAIQQTLAHGYAHHIQRLMVTGLYALLLGVDPQAVHAWYLAVYVDAVEWVELPNTLGMSQYADGGLMASKPYIASGQYIQRMSSGRLCAGCRFKPTQRTGPEACPFTTLYWDFLQRHRGMLAANKRTAMQVRNLDRLSDGERAAIRAQAAQLRDSDGEPLAPPLPMTSATAAS